MDRHHVSSGTEWESAVGYSRAVRVGRHVYVSGTTATDTAGAPVDSPSAYGQTQIILEKIANALREVGANMSDVVRTRTFVTDIDHWSEVGRAHGDVFGEIRPAATMVEVRRLIHPALLVEIEVDAVITAQYSPS